MLYSRDNDSAVRTQVAPLQQSADQLGLRVFDISVAGDATADTELPTAILSGLEALRAVDPELRRSVLLVTGSTAVYERIALVHQHAGRVPVVSMLPEIGRASCRERVCQSVYLSVVDVSFTQQHNTRYTSSYDNSNNQFQFHFKA